MRRRQFISKFSTAAGLAGLAGCGGGSDAALPLAENPAPVSPSQPQTQPQPPAPVTPPEAGHKVALNFDLVIATAVAGRDTPFTAGQAFKRGHVPIGSSVFAELDSFQCVVKNRWPDGSVKFAVLSGRTGANSSTRKVIPLFSGPASVQQSDLSLGNLRASGVSASVRFGDLGSVSWAGEDWDHPFKTWVSGPTMSSWIYRRAIGSDPHLVAWMEVRCYSGGEIEVLPWLENGYVKVANPNSKAGVVSFVLGGKQRLSQELSLLNHQRAVLCSGSQLTHWLGEENTARPQHDVEYLKATRLIPNYRGRTPAGSSLYTRLAASYTPLARANMPATMGSAGYDLSIGLLPEWDVAYFTTNADARAFVAVVINGFAAGRYGTHFRDESTLRPIRFSSYPNLALGEGSGIANNGGSSVMAFTPTASGGSPPMYASSHHPSMGYLAYLLTGWHYFVEECQFVATLNYLKQSDTGRSYSKGLLVSSQGANTTRGVAWALRTLSQATCITPDDDPLRVEFIASIDANIQYYHSNYVAKSNNPLGLVWPYDNYNSGSGPWRAAIWMDDFLTAALGHLKELDVCSQPIIETLNALLTWKYRSVVGRLGGSGKDEFAYPFAAQYTVAYAPSASCDWTGAGPWFASWGEVARAMAIPTEGADGAPLASGDPAEPTSYWGNLLPAIASAVDHGAVGASTAWHRVASASNFPGLASGFDSQPVWGIVPR